MRIEQERQHAEDCADEVQTVFEEFMQGVTNMAEFIAQCEAISVEHDPTIRDDKNRPLTV